MINEMSMFLMMALKNNIPTKTSTKQQTKIIYNASYTYKKNK